jgi:DNA-binding winged helix-turn-helix (wHTH) protein
MLDAEFYRVQWVELLEKTASLTEEVACLKERISDIENQALTLGMRITSAFGGQPQVGRTLAVLMRMCPLPVARDAIESIIQHKRDSCRIKLLDVNICKARKVMRAMGYDGGIVTIWGHGYQITKEAKAAIMQIIERHESVNGHVNDVLRKISQYEEAAA